MPDEYTLPTDVEFYIHDVTDYKGRVTARKTPSKQRHVLRNKRDSDVDNLGEVAFVKTTTELECYKNTFTFIKSSLKIKTQPNELLCISSDFKELSKVVVYIYTE